MLQSLMMHFMTYIQFYRKDFPALSFRRPCVNTCKTCNLLNIQAKSTVTVLSTISKLLVQVHHKKPREFLWPLRKMLTDSTLPGNDKHNSVMDLQKLFSVPKLTHSNMYYCRQLSWFNFWIHVSNTVNAIMCLWHEEDSGHGGNEMAS